MSQTSKSDPRWHSWLDTLANIAQLLGILGLAFYAIGRYSAERFYRHFGLTPEDVGQTYATLVWPAAVAAALYGFTLFGVSWLVSRIIVPKERPLPSKRYWLVLIALPIIYLALLRSNRENGALSTETVFWWCVWYGAIWGAFRCFADRRRLRAKEENNLASVEKQLRSQRWFILPFVVLPLFNGAVLTTLDY